MYLTCTRTRHNYATSRTWGYVWFLKKKKTVKTEVEKRRSSAKTEKKITEKSARIDTETKEFTCLIRESRFNSISCWVPLSYVFGQRRGNSCPPSGESSGGGGGAASRQVVVVRPPPPAISSVLPTTFQYGLPSCPAAVAVAKSYGYRTFSEKLPACGTVKTPWWPPLTRKGRWSLLQVSFSLNVSKHSVLFELQQKKACAG